MRQHSIYFQWNYVELSLVFVELLDKEKQTVLCQIQNRNYFCFNVFVFLM